MSKKPSYQPEIIFGSVACGAKIADSTAKTAVIRDHGIHAGKRDVLELRQHNQADTDDTNEHGDQKQIDGQRQGADTKR